MKSLCSTSLSVAVIKHSDQKPLRVSKGPFQLIAYHWGKLEQDLKQEPEAETMQECCLVAYREAHGYLAFMCSPGPPVSRTGRYDFFWLIWTVSLHRLPNLPTTGRLLDTHAPFVGCTRPTQMPFGSPQKDRLTVRSVSLLSFLEWMLVGTVW